jgi:hypothetical protein
MLVFEKSIINKFWPKDEQNEEKDIIRQLYIQVDAELDNSKQVAELFNCMVRGLVRISFVNTLSGEEYILPAVTIKPFNIKQKKIKIGKGDEVEVYKTEFAALTLICRLPEEGGPILTEIYRFFNRDVRMTVEEFASFREQQTAAADVKKISKPVSDEKE